MKRYVLMIGISDDLSQVVMLKKLRGPKKLLGKLNFPGGHIEAEENAREAAVREFAEETGVQLSLACVEFLHFVSVPGEYSLSTYYIASDAIKAATSRTDEPVHVVPVATVLSDETWAEMKFCPGTPQSLRAVMHRLQGVPRDIEATS